MSKIEEINEKLSRLDIKINGYEKNHHQLREQLGKILINRGQILNNVNGKKCRVFKCFVEKSFKREDGYELCKVQATRILKSGEDGKDFMIYWYSFKDWGVK